MHLAALLKIMTLAAGHLSRDCPTGGYAAFGGQSRGGGGRTCYVSCRVGKSFTKVTFLNRIYPLSDVQRRWSPEP